MGIRSASQYFQFPSLRPRSSMSCMAQISHSTAHSVSQPLYEAETGGMQVLFSYCLWAHSARLVGCTKALVNVSYFSTPQGVYDFAFTSTFKRCLIGNKGMTSISFVFYMILKITNIPFYVLFKTFP